MRRRGGSMTLGGRKACSRSITSARGSPAGEGCLARCRLANFTRFSILPAASLYLADTGGMLQVPINMLRDR